MALRNTVRNAVDSAFRAIGDLAVDVELTDATNSSYDFSTGSARVSKLPKKTVKGVLINASNTALASARGLKTNRNQDVLLMKRSDLTTPTKYDYFVVAGKRYNVQSFNDNGYTVEFIVSGV